MSLKSLLSWSLSVAAITLTVGAHAAPTEKSLQDKINAILVAAPQKGQRAEYQQFVNYYYSAGTSFDTEVERDVRYLSVIGLVDISGEFFPQVINTVTESWRKTEIGWDVTQQIREVTLDGRVYKSLSHVLVFEGPGRLKDRRQLPSLDAAADQAEFATEIDGWYAEIFQ